MRTLHTGLRVSDPERSLRFYAALGYRVVGSVRGTPLGDLTIAFAPRRSFRRDRARARIR